MIGKFSSESLAAAHFLLYAEGQETPYEGKCGQKKLQEAAAQARTPAQQQADQKRAQARRGKDVIPSATRSEAAKKAAETRRRCKGLPSNPASRVKS